jgi:hypothetical protein
MALIFILAFEKVGWQRYYWLDFPKLAGNLISGLDNSVLSATKYFYGKNKCPGG